MELGLLSSLCFLTFSFIVKDSFLRIFFLLQGFSLKMFSRIGKFREICSEHSYKPTAVHHSFPLSIRESTSFLDTFHSKL